MSRPQNQTLDFAALVELITESVVGRLRASSLPGEPARVDHGAPARPPAARARPPAARARRIAWLLAAPCGHLEPLCRELTVLARLGHQQLVVACPDVVDGLRAAPGWPGEGDGLRLCVVSPDGQGVSAILAELAGLAGLADQADQELVYVGSLGWHQAAAVAALDDRDGFVQLMLGALAAGKPVFLVAGETLSGLQGLAPGSRAPASSAPASSAPALSAPASSAPASSALTRQAGILWRSLEAVGVERLALAELRRPLAALETATGTHGRALGGLLTERDVEEAAAAGLSELRLSRSTLITPMARDRARALDLRIEQV